MLCGRSSFAGWHCSCSLNRIFCLGFKCCKRKKVIASFKETLFSVFFNCWHPQGSMFSLHENKPKAFLGGG